MQATRGTPLTEPEAPAGRASQPRRTPLVLLGSTALLVVALDQLSKALVVHYLEHDPPRVVIRGVLDLEVARNSGAAFSIGTGSTWVFTLIAVAVVVVIARVARRLTNPWWALALGLLLGGAVGNLVDRLVRSPGFPHGHVVDWVHLHHWPVFNLADSAITVGGVVAVLLSLRDRGPAGS